MNPKLKRGLLLLGTVWLVLIFQVISSEIIEKLRGIDLTQILALGLITGVILTLGVCRKKL